MNSGGAAQNMKNFYYNRCIIDKIWRIFIIIDVPLIAFSGITSLGLSTVIKDGGWGMCSSGDTKF